MIHHEYPAGNAAAERLARFKERPDIQRVTAQYADWSKSEGSVVNVELAALAMLRLAGRISRQDYKRSVRKLAERTKLPVQDFLLIAKCILELSRFMLADSGQIPFTPDVWDTEDKEA